MKIIWAWEQFKEEYSIALKQSQKEKSVVYLVFIPELKQFNRAKNLENPCNPNKREIVVEFDPNNIYSLKTAYLTDMITAFSVWYEHNGEKL
jgi:hypothetical protein